MDIYYLAVQKDLAAGRLLKAIEDLHQGRFARPVLSQQGVYLARLDVKVHVVASQDARKALDDTDHLQVIDARQAGGEQV